MKFKYIIFVILINLLSIKNAYAFSNCQIKYDSDKRALSSLKGMCNVCHISPSGAGPQNEFGRGFANAGFMITDELVAKFPEFFQKQEPKDAKPTIPSPLPPTSSSSGSVPVPIPVLQRIKPTLFILNKQSMASVTGQNFVDGAKAFIDDNEVLTTVKSKALVIIDFVLNSKGTHTVKVKNPDGQESNILKIKGK